MAEAVTPPGGAPDISLLEYLWREYEYRHDLCWRAVYKVTFAVGALAIVPYLREDLTISSREGRYCRR